MNCSKIVKADMESPRQELSNSGLGIMVALLVRPGIGFSCVSTWGPIQLYHAPKMIFKTLFWAKTVPNTIAR